MLFPFITLFRKSKKNYPYFQFRNSSAKETLSFIEKTKEYDSRIHEFEKSLDTGQYQMYMDLRVCANECLLLQNRIEYSLDRDRMMEMTGK